MDKILSIQTIKNVFAALGAKTSDDNYGVALLDKTTAEPKGLMGMSDLQSVLGLSDKINYRVLYDTTLTDLKTATKTGWAFISTGEAQNITDKPSNFGSNGAFFLGVLGGKGAQDLTQILVRQDDSRIWLRGLWNNTIVVDWKQIAFATT